MSILQRRLVRVAAVAVAVIVWGGVLVAPTGASAAIVINRATGLASPDVLIDFGSELFTDFTVITNQFASSGVTFGPNTAYATTEVVFPSVSGGFLRTVSAASQPGSIFFTSDVTDAVFSWRTAPSNTTFQAFLNGGLVASFTAAANANFPEASGKFYGFEGIVFDEIRLAISGAVDFTLDNLQYNVFAVTIDIKPGSFPLAAMSRSNFRGTCPVTCFGK